MSYPMSDCARQWQAIARDFANRLMVHEEAAEAADGVIDQELHAAHRRQAVAIGFPRMDAPVDQGGLGLSLFEQVVVWEQLGRVTNALTWCFSEAQSWMFEACSDDQIARYIRPLMSGDRIECYAITEAEAGSDSHSIKATARRDGDDYVIDGEKWFVTGANKADFLFVEALVGESGDHALFFVDRDVPGLSEIDNPQFGHAFPFHHPTLRFSGVRVPAANRIGAEGQGMEFVRNWYRHERLTIAARCCGAAERLIEEGMAFAKTRIVSGQPIAEFQLIQAMLTDSLTDLWSARLVTYEAAALQERGADLSVLHTHCAMAKLVASEMAGRVADRMVQIFGGRGYMRRNVAQRFFRELRVDRIWEGTSEIQRLVIARSMLKRGVAGIIG